MSLAMIASHRKKAVASYATEILADIPAVYYKCQETSGTALVDSSGNGLDGSLVNGAVPNDSVDSSAGPDLGAHIRLDGVDDYLLLNTGDWLTPGTTGFTVEGWFRVRSTQNWQRFFDFANSASASDIVWGRSGSTTNMFALASGGTNQPAGAMPPLNSWHHFAMTVTPSGAGKVYVDGALVASPTFPTQTNGPRINKYIGKSAYSADAYNGMSVTQIAVYNSVLSAARISAHYNAAFLTPRPSNTTYRNAVLADAPLAVWQMDDLSGTTMVDSVAARNGTYLGTFAFGQDSLLSNDLAKTSVAFTPIGRGQVASAAWMDVDYLTAEAWIRPDAFGGNRQIVCRDNLGSAGELAWRLQLEGSKLRGYVFPTVGSLASVLGATTLIANTTYHVALTYDGSTIKIYVNGVLDGSVALSGVARKTGKPIGVGSLPGSAEGFSGKIDEVAFYGSALSAARILAHYNAGLAA